MGIQHSHVDMVLKWKSTKGFGAIGAHSKIQDSEGITWLPLIYCVNFVTAHKSQDWKQNEIAWPDLWYIDQHGQSMENFPKNLPYKEPSSHTECICFTIVNDILLHRNDSDCQNNWGCLSFSARLTSIYINLWFWSEKKLVCRSTCKLRKHSPAHLTYNIFLAISLTVPRARLCVISLSRSVTFTCSE